MEAIWVQSVHNLHCPSCDSRLVQRAERRFHAERQIPVYVGEVGTLSCPDGHPLPDRQELYDYRAQQGHAPAAPVSAVVPAAS